MAQVKPSQDKSPQDKPSQDKALHSKASQPKASQGKPLQSKAAQGKSLHDLFIETLKDIYYAEKQVLRALPKMARTVQSPELKSAFEKHHDQTEGQIERLEQIFELLGKPARGKHCPAIVGIVEESKEIMEDFAGTQALDAGVLAAAQAVEHYEIARYGTLKTWASQLGLMDAVPLLEETLKEEQETDLLLTRLAGAEVNKKAA